MAGHVRRELEQQAFPQVAGADARRVEPLDQKQGLLGLLDADRAIQVADDILERQPEIAALVQVVDDVLGQGVHLGIAIEEAELIDQVVVERSGPRRHILHRVLLAVGVLAQRRPAAPRALVVDLAPVLVQVDQAIELVGLGVGLGLGGRRRRLLGIALRLARLAELQHRILAQLLLDPLLQGHDRQLQDFHRLDHARRHSEAHLGPHLLGRVEPHDPLVRSQKVGRLRERQRRGHRRSPGFASLL